MNFLFNKDRYHQLKAGYPQDADWLVQLAASDAALLTLVVLIIGVCANIVLVLW